MSTAAETSVPAGNGHHAQNYDVEKALNGEGGAGLARQISVQLTAEQFERLYLQPGGVGGKGDLSKRLGNPTALGLLSFLLSLSPLSAFLCGWAKSTNEGAVALAGVFYFIGGFGLTLAGVMEWILGNTFPSTVFISFGGYYLAFAVLQDPAHGISMALPPTGADYNKGLAWYFAAWGTLTLIYMIAALRTNVVFVLLFFFLDILFWLLVAIYFKVGAADVAHIETLSKAAGSFGVLTVACGWYLLIAVLCGTTGVPMPLPVGDLSGFLSRKKID